MDAICVPSLIPFNSAPGSRVPVSAGVGACVLACLQGTSGGVHSQENLPAELGGLQACSLMLRPI